MKCLLRTTTALVGVAATAGPAAAAEPIKLMVGGFFREAYMVNFDDDGEGALGNERNTDGFFNDAEIFFMGMTTLDNGLSVGARVELEGEDNEGDQIDEAWIHFSGGFGEVRIGSNDEALVGACILPPGGTDNFSAFSPNQWAANTSPFSPGFPALSSNAVCIGVDDREDAQKIVYMTPVFGGFQLRVSYTPNGGDERHGDGVGAHLGMPTNADAESRHNVSVYATYELAREAWGLTAGSAPRSRGMSSSSPAPISASRPSIKAGSMSPSEHSRSAACSSTTTTCCRSRAATTRMDGLPAAAWRTSSRTSSWARNIRTRARRSIAPAAAATISPWTAPW
ncbi:MAG: porin [Rhodospirillales bacterium]|nr:porin [Rhodospirillales bacterium]